MTIHERIKARRKECRLSADEVAAELGVSRATVYRYESAEITNMGIDKIEPLARVLHTTPEYLMGWTDDPIDYEDGDILAEIPLSYMKLFNGDAAQAYHYMQAVDAENTALPDSKFRIKNPDIRMIARAGNKMTPEQAENLRKYAQYMFPEAFEE